jgi:hypothetical protein
MESFFREGVPSREMNTKFSPEKLKGRDHMEDLGVDFRTGSCVMKCGLVSSGSG